MTTLPPPPPPPQKPSGATPEIQLPTGAQLLRALRAPAIGYAWLLVGAIAMMVLIVVAANVGSTGEDTGVDSDDTNALGVLIGMPFQIAGMALLGSLRFREDGLSASLFLPPLLLTALYVVMTARAARRSEVVPAAGTRAVLGIVVGLAAAVVADLVTWLLAMRTDGVSVHAASVGLFFGTWVLTGVASYVGSSRAAGAARPAWLPPDYASAARVWASSVGLWVVAASVVLTVVAVVEEGLWLGILVPVWGGTAGLWSYAVGHFGALYFAGDGVDAGDFSAAWTVALVAGALVLAGITSVAWHLRRDSTPASLAQPGSWIPLPTAFAVGGLVVWLLPTVSLGGAYSGVAGSAKIQPGFWLLFVLIGWGLAVEAGSRFVAPRVVGTLPPQVRSALQGPERTTAPAAGGPVPATAPRPLTTAERRLYTRIGIGVGALGVVVVLGAIAVSVVNSHLYSPEDQATAYLDAVVDGDLDQVNDLAPTDDDYADSSLLTSEIYRAADHRVTGYEIGDVDEDGDTVTVHVRLTGLEKSADAELTLAKDGHSAGVFDRWRVTDGGLARVVSFYVPDGVDSLSVDDVRVDVPGGDVWLLPGDYDLDPYADNPWVESAGEPVTVTAADDYQVADVPAGVASDAFREEVQSQVDDYLAQCIASTELEPEDCPNTAYAGTDVRNVVWTLDASPTPDFEYFDGSFPADLSYGDSGHATVTYEADESYGYGKPDWQPETDDTDLYLDSISVTENGDDLDVAIGD